MLPSIPDQYRRWFEYERDSHAKTLASLEAVPADMRSAPGFQKAVDLLAHIVQARWLWLFRMGLEANAPRDIFPQNVPLHELPRRLVEMEGAWSGYLSRLDEAELARPFDYRSTEGDPYRNVVHDILAQLFGHSSYHRGQIAALIRALGCEPAVTDFLFWTREPIVDR